jgi:predicted ferric reductase
MDKRKKQFLILTGVFSLYLIIFIIYIVDAKTNVLEEFIRILALFGLLSLFISSIMAAFTREIYKLFGKPFKKVHHYIALSALILITTHPILIAINYTDASVFVPDFSSSYAFWALAGRPALYLIFIAVIAGFLQTKIKRYWRYIHGLNYVALVFGVVHGMLIGSNLSRLVALKVIYVLMLVLVTFSFVLKRYQTYKRKKRIKTKKQEKNTESIQNQ